MVDIYGSLFILIDFKSILSGGLAQLGERVNGIHEVVGSNPIPSTRFS